MSIETKLGKFLFLFLLSVFIFSACDKNENEGDGWANCTECTTDSWVGEYSGTGDYSNFNNNTEMNNVDVSIVIEETATDYLTVYFHVPDVYSSTVSGDLQSPDIVSFASSGSSFTATMFIKDNELKLTGNSKKFHYKNDTILILDEVVTFETIKNQ